MDISFQTTFKLELDTRETTKKKKLQILWMALAGLGNSCLFKLFWERFAPGFYFPSLLSSALCSDIKTS